MSATYNNAKDFLSFSDDGQEATKQQHRAQIGHTVRPLTKSTDHSERRDSFTMNEKCSRGDSNPHKLPY